MSELNSSPKARTPIKAGRIFYSAASSHARLARSFALDPEASTLASSLSCVCRSASASLVWHGETKLIKAQQKILSLVTQWYAFATDCETRSGLTFLACDMVFMRHRAPCCCQSGKRSSTCKTAACVIQTSTSTGLGCRNLNLPGLSFLFAIWDCMCHQHPTL